MGLSILHGPQVLDMNITSVGSLLVLQSQNGKAAQHNSSAPAVQQAPYGPWVMPSYLCRFLIASSPLKWSGARPVELAAVAVAVLAEEADEDAVLQIAAKTTQSHIVKPT